MTSRARLLGSKLAIRHLLLLIPWLVVGIAARIPIHDNSFLWHIRAGTVQIADGAVITNDPFSFTARGQAWRTQSWLIELAYGQLERWTGLEFVWVMVLVVGTATLSCLALISFPKVRAATWLGAYLIVSAVLLASFLNPRPVIFSFLLFGLLIITANEKRLWWTIPFIFWLWSATHGSWIIGGVYLILEALRSSKPRLALNVLPAAVAVLLTAHGWGVLEILWQFVESRNALALISEWAPTNFSSIGYFPMLLAILLLVIPAKRGQVSVRDLWILAPFLFLATNSARSVPIAWLAFAPIVALIGWRVPDPGPLRGGDGRRIFLNLALGLIVIGLPFWISPTPGIDTDHFPVEASRFLRSDRVFHSDVTGGYLIYADWPERLVMLDDRAELYGDLFSEFIELRNADGEWRRFIHNSGVEQALLRKTEPIVEVLIADGWTQQFQDDNFVVLRKP